MRHLLTCWPLLVFVAQASALDDLAATRLHALAMRLGPLHTPMGPAEPGDWLEAHAEAGQTFAQWRAAPRNLPAQKRRTIYLQPLGAFDDARAFLVADTVAFLGAFFQLPVRLQPVLDLGDPPARARRVNPATKRTQWRTDWLLQQLRAHRPDDAIAVLGLTATDLWPGEDWNFVFGMATYDQRVGVWSVARFGDPAQDRLGLLRRTLKTALHETGHMFTMHHCTAWNCLMSGSNNLRETDRRTMDACPECTAKIWELSGCDPAARFQALATLAGEHGLEAEQAHWLHAAEALIAK